MSFYFSKESLLFLVAPSFFWHPCVPSSAPRPDQTHHILSLLDSASTPWHVPLPFYYLETANIIDRLSWNSSIIPCSSCLMPARHSHLHHRSLGPQRMRRQLSAFLLSSTVKTVWRCIRLLSLANHHRSRYYFGVLLLHHRHFLHHSNRVIL